MTPKELRSQARSAPFVYLTVRRDSIPKGQKIRLTMSGGPLGKICNAREVEDRRYEITACWESKAVLKFLDKMEALT